MHLNGNAKNRGFTLIELLIVIAIMLSLAGIVMVAIVRSGEKGRQVECLSNLRQLGIASLMYAQDNNGYLPPFRNCRQSSGDSTRGYMSPELLYNALMAYIKNQKVWYCPSDPLAGQDVDQWQVNHLYSSYFFNSRKELRLRDDGYYTRGGKIIQTSDYALIRDANMDYFPPVDWSVRPIPGCEHFEGVNVFYLDGHAKWSTAEL